VKLKLWLTILRPAPDWCTIEYGVPSELYWREIETGALPGDGDHVVLYPPDDPDESDHGGPYLYAQKRYLGPHGAWHIELQRIVVDPPPWIQHQINAPSYRDYSVWWVVDGSNPDPVSGLLKAGWLPYGEERP
jgi:hypothetical protein